MTPRKASGDDILVASESFSGEMADGTAFAAQNGVTRVRASHPAVKRWPDYFKPIDVHYDVEQATAAPGERRAPTPAEAKAVAHGSPSSETGSKVEAATKAPGEKRP
jgi:hypothetical protein